MDICKYRGQIYGWRVKLCPPLPFRRGGGTVLTECKTKSPTYPSGGAGEKVREWGRLSMSSREGFCQFYSGRVGQVSTLRVINIPWYLHKYLQ